MGDEVVRDVVGAELLGRLSVCESVGLVGRVVCRVDIRASEIQQVALPV